MLETIRQTQVFEGLAAKDIPIAALIEAQQPAILKGVAKDWPLVERGRASAQAVMDYLAGFDVGRSVVGFTGAPQINGRFFYNEDLTGLNFTAKRVGLRDFLQQIARHLEDAASPSFYIGSTDVEAYLPGLYDANHLDNEVLANVRPTVSAWIGNRTVATCHYDFSNNIACNLVGHRRFILFPPEQVHNLYPGPLSPTPGGQVVSMVDFTDPDFDRHPRFRQALAAAQVAQLEPGDLLIYPAMWWHQVEALDAFNVMINYWWNDSPSFIDTPMTTLLHGLLSLRDRPNGEKRAWRELFDYYVFGAPDEAGKHLPSYARGPLAPMDEKTARRLRAELLQRLNR